MRSRLTCPAQTTIRRALLGAGFALLIARFVPTSVAEEPKKPPFELSGMLIIDPLDPKTAHQPPPRIEILQPAPGSNFRPDESIDCVVRITLPEGRDKPPPVVVALMKDNVIWGSYGAKPLEKVSDRVYTYKAELKGNPQQKRTGPYRLEVEAIDAYWKKFRPYSSPIPDKIVRTHFSIPVEFTPEKIAERIPRGVVPG